MIRHLGGNSRATCKTIGHHQVQRAGVSSRQIRVLPHDPHNRAKRRQAMSLNRHVP
jgi:hypothetical protein